MFSGGCAWGRASAVGVGAGWGQRPDFSALLAWNRLGAELGDEKCWWPAAHGKKPRPSAGSSVGEGFLAGPSGVVP